MNGYSVFKKAYDMEPSTTDCIRMNIMKQRNPMKKIIFMILLVGSISGQNSILKQFSDAFADIAEKANPAVVTILTEKKVDLSQLHGQLPQDNDFFKFFAPRMPRQREYKSTALGSGVIVNSRKGYVITNNHVVDDIDEITVRLLDKTEYKATVVGRDPKSDLAVLQIDARGLTDLDFGNSDKLRVGEWVIAVGSPFSANLSHTVTAGIVSAKGRGNIIQGDVYEDFIQTDAAINPGNSGGALLNSAGDLIGINTAIYTNSFDRSNKGVGFAIPSNMVKQVMADLIQHGKVLRSWIGVQIQPLNDSSARAMGLKSPDGALVSDVVKDGPAKKAGVKTGLVENGRGQFVAGLDGAPELYRVVSFPDDRHLIGALFKMAVDAVGGDIERAILIPFDRHIARRIASVFDLCVRGHPVEALALFAPKGIGIVNRTLIHFLVYLQLQHNILLFHVY
jgi:S1-C subfamily serine protease